MYKYRLYPTNGQAQRLDFLLWQARMVYNAALEERITAYKERGESVRAYDQIKRFRKLRNDNANTLGLLNSNSMAYVILRLDKAFQAFFRRLKAGEKPGFPRFKGRNRFNSLEFVYGNGCKLANDDGKARLRLQNVGDVKVKYHRPIPDSATIKYVIVKRRNRKWYVCLALEFAAPEPPPHTGAPVGVDMGLHHLLALSDGAIIENPRWLRHALARLRVAQRRMARRKKGSNGWREAAFQVAKLHERIANQRHDFWHKTTRRLVNTYSLIALEDLTLRFMTANGNLALSAHDAGLAEFQQLLAYKAESAGVQVVTVNPAYTSQVCSACGAVVEKSLSERVHRCTHCGYTADRDVNAARNILFLAVESARTGPPGANVAGCGVRSPETPRDG
jgi:putative transposase